MTVLLQVLTLFMLMLCGLIAVKTRLMSDRDIGVINTFVLNFAQVGMIIANLQQDASPELIIDLGWTFLLTCLSIALFGFMASRLFRREPAARRGVLTCLSMVSNCGYMGFPVIIAAMGESALIYAAVYIAGFNLMGWTLCAYYFGGRQAMQPRALLRNPSLIAVVIGLCIFLTGFRLPGFLYNALDALGSTTTPLAMFIIGARLATLRPAHLKDRSLLLVCALRLVVFPLALLAVLRLTPLSKTVADALYLCTAMPCAALTAMQADLFDCDRGLASRGVALSTALSLATVPLMLMLI